jgi:hypothetical protein
MFVCLYLVTLNETWCVPLGKIYVCLPAWACVRACVLKKWLHLQQQEQEQLSQAGRQSASSSNWISPNGAADRGGGGHYGAFFFDRVASRHMIDLRCSSLSLHH